MKSAPLTVHDKSEKFHAKLKARNIEVHACYQCGRCSAGCPIGDFFDLTVMEVVRLAAYGEVDRLLQSHTVWLCAACETCATRCPNGIEIAALMDVLRELALRRNTPPAEPRIAQFHQAMVGSIKGWGRVWEIGMIGTYKMASKDFTRDFDLGLSMFLKGKLKPWPHRIKGCREVAEIFSGKGKEFER